MRSLPLTLALALLLSACGYDSAAPPEASTTENAGEAPAEELAATAAAAEVEDLAAREASVPENPLKDAYFGETHLHTGVSMDAFIGGNRLTPDDAYRFAKGEELMVNGSPHRIKRPLDFCAVTDHSEFMGEAYSLMNPGAPGYDHPVAKSFREAEDLDTALGLYGKYVLEPLSTGGDPHPPFFQGEEAIASTWQKNYEATERHYEPGTFTTIHGYEWTSAPGGANLHRNVLFRDANVPEIPFSSNESADPEDLWAWRAWSRSSR
ncbi:MAG: DUF3604 domain-containing protein [Gammaproteobacteria bacterium]